MNIKIDFQIYPYGKVWNMLDKKIDESKKDEISIYVSPKTFDKVPLSSLEGYFVVFSDRSIIQRPFVENFSGSIPQCHIKRDNLSKLEEEYNGKFHPFEK